jgi:hypothetical protein
MKVTYAAKGDYVELQDTKNPSIRIGLFPTHEGSDKIEVVEKAKPKVGDVITGDEIVARTWNPGTTVRGKSGGVYMLDASGSWRCSSNGKFGRGSMGGTWLAELLYVA